jgi:hypothetical protein
VLEHKRMIAVQGGGAETRDPERLLSLKEAVLEGSSRGERERERQ